MAHLFEVPPEEAGDDTITSYFWMVRPDAIPVRGSEWKGGVFQA